VVANKQADSISMRMAKGSSLGSLVPRVLCIFLSQIYCTERESTMLSPAGLKTECMVVITPSNLLHCSGVTQSWGGAGELGYFWSYSFIDVL